MLNLLGFGNFFPNLLITITFVLTKYIIKVNNIEWESLLGHRRI